MSKEETNRLQDTFSFFVWHKIQIPAYRLCREWSKRIIQKLGKRHQTQKVDLITIMSRKNGRKYYRQRDTKKKWRMMDVSRSVQFDTINIVGPYKDTAWILFNVPTIRPTRIVSHIDNRSNIFFVRFNSRELILFSKNSHKMHLYEVVSMKDKGPVSHLKKRSTAAKSLKLRVENQP